MAILVNSAVQVSFKGTWQGQRIILTQNYVVSANASANSVVQDLGTIVGYFNLGGAGAFRTNYLLCLPTNYTLNFIRAQVIAPFRSVYVDVASNVVGTYGGSASTGNLQFPITLYTANGGRNQIAVKKIGPAGDSSYVNGAPENTFKAGALTGFAAELTQQQVTLAPAITLDPIVMHPGGTFTPVIGSRLPDRVGTMRRRTLRVGE